MDLSLVIALIPPAVTLVVGIATVLKKPNISIPTRREIKYRQLSELFEPIEKIFFLNPAGDPEWVFSEVLNVVIHQLAVAPYDFLSIVMKIREKETVSTVDIYVLQKCADSYYNYLRKMFGFPYISEKIDWERRIMLWVEKIRQNTLPIMFVLLIVICLLEAILLMAVEPQPVGSPYFEQHPGLIFIFSLCMVIFWILYMLREH